MVSKLVDGVLRYFNLPYSEKTVKIFCVADCNEQHWYKKYFLFLPEALACFSSCCKGKRFLMSFFSLHLNGSLKKIF